MTRRDFQLIADAVNAAQYGVPFFQGVRAVAHELADRLATTNPHFDRERFLAACKLEKP